MLCQMTINFASEASKTSHDLLKDLQARVSSGQVGNLKVDATHILSMESVPSKFLSSKTFKLRYFEQGIKNPFQG